jgi:hypothetical protein
MHSRSILEKQFRYTKKQSTLVLKNPATLLQLCYKIVNKETILNKNAISKSKDYTESKYNIHKISFIAALIVNLSFFWLDV